MATATLASTTAIGDVPVGSLDLEAFKEYLAKNITNDDLLDKYWYQRCIKDYQQILGGEFGDVTIGHTPPLVDEILPPPTPSVVKMTPLKASTMYHKLPNKTWRDFYEDLQKEYGSPIFILLKSLNLELTVEVANYAAATCNLFGLKFLIKNHVYPDSRGSNIAAAKGYIDYFEFLAAGESAAPPGVPPVSVSKDGTAAASPEWLPTVKGLNAAAENNHGKVIEWAARYKLFPDIVGCNLMAKNGHLSLLKKINNLVIFKMLPNQQGINWAVENGHLDMLIYINPSEYDIKSINIAASRGFINIIEYCNIFPEESAIMIACLNNHHEVVDWCTENNVWSLKINDFQADAADNAVADDAVESEKSEESLMNKWQDIANVVASKGYLNVLKALAFRNIFPDKNGLHLTLENKQYKTFYWLLDRKIPVDISTLDYLIKEIVKIHESSKHPMFECLITLLDLKYLPSPETIAWLAERGIIGMIKLLVRYGIKPDENMANLLIHHYKFAIMSFLDDNKLYPSLETIDNLLVTGGPTGGSGGSGGSSGSVTEIIRWLLARHKLPSVHGANNAAKYGNLEIVILLGSFGIYPNNIGANEAAANNKMEVMEYLLKKNIYPDMNGLNRTAENGHLEMLKILAAVEVPNGVNGFWSLLYTNKKRLIPDAVGLQMATDRCQHSVVAWLKAQ